MLATVSAMLRHGVIVLATYMLAVLIPSPVLAQGSGTVTGMVTRAGEGSPLPSVSVTVQSTGLSTITGPDGRYTLRRVPEGAQTIVFRWLGYKPMEIRTTVEADRTATVYAAMEAVPVALTELVVSTASRTPERLVEAPAAISVVQPQVLENTSITRQAPPAPPTLPRGGGGPGGGKHLNVK